MKVIEIDPAVSYKSFRVHQEYANRVMIGDSTEVRDLADGCGFTFSEVQEALEDLRRRGYLKAE